MLQEKIKIVKIFLTKNKTSILNFFTLASFQYIDIFSRLISSIILAKFLSPYHYGAISSLVFCFNLSNWFSDWGWENYLLNSKKLNLQKNLTSILTLRSILGIFPGIAAILISLFFKQSIISLVALFGFYFWLSKMNNTLRVTAEKLYLQKTVSRINLIANLTANLAAVISAANNLAFYALFIQKIVRNIILFFSLKSILPFETKLGSIKSKPIKESFYQFGIATWLSNLFGIASRDSIPFLITISSSASQAGLYSKAFSLAILPLTVSEIFDKITTPIFSNNQMNIEKIYKPFFWAQMTKIIIILPMQIILFTFSKSWILFLLGPQWINMVPIYKTMCVYGFFRAFNDDLKNMVKIGIQSPWIFTNAQIVLGVATLISTPLIVRHQAFGAAIGISLAMLASTVFLWNKILNFFKVNFSRKKPRLKSLSCQTKN